MIGEHSEADKERSDARNLDALDKRISKLLDGLNPRKDPDLLKPVKGASLLTEWERALGQLGSLIVLDEIATIMLQELPVLEAQVRAEAELVDEIGAEGMKRIPPITLKDYKKIAQDLDDEEGRGV